MDAVKGDAGAWNTPIHLSPTRRGAIYIVAQFLFRSRDYGQTWDRISPDLTTNKPEKQKKEQSCGIIVDKSAQNCARPR